MAGEIGQGSTKKKIRSEKVAWILVVLLGGYVLFSGGFIDVTATDNGFCMEIK
jgi:hypothetical protein